MADSELMAGQAEIANGLHDYGHGNLLQKSVMLQHDSWGVPADPHKDRTVSNVLGQPRNDSPNRRETKRADRHWRRFVGGEPSSRPGEHSPGKATMFGAKQVARTRWCVESPSQYGVDRVDLHTGPAKLPLVPYWPVSFVDEALKGRATGQGCRTAESSAVRQLVDSSAVQLFTS